MRTFPNITSLQKMAPFNFLSRFFERPPSTTVGYLIPSSGLKGHQISHVGGINVDGKSKMYANFEGFPVCLW